MLLATMDPSPPTGFVNCTVTTSSAAPQPPMSQLLNRDPAQVQLSHLQTPSTAPPLHPARNTYLWSAASAESIAKADRQLAISAPKWDTDAAHGGTICDTNAAATMGPDGISLVGLWRRCETPMLHTVPHTLTARNASNPGTYAPNVSVNFPFMSHAGAEDPVVYTCAPPGADRQQHRGDREGSLVPVYHALMHDEQVNTASPECCSSYVSTHFYGY